EGPPRDDRREPLRACPEARGGGLRRLRQDIREEDAEDRVPPDRRRTAGVRAVRQPPRSPRRKRTTPVKNFGGLLYAAKLLHPGAVSLGLRRDRLPGDGTRAGGAGPRGDSGVRAPKAHALKPAVDCGGDDCRSVHGRPRLDIAREPRTGPPERRSEVLLRDRL